MKLEKFNWIETRAPKDEDWVISEIMINPNYIVSVEPINHYYRITTTNGTYDVIDKPKQFFE